MTLVTVPTPGPSGTNVPLATFGTLVAADINELITDLTAILSARTAFTPTWASTGTAVALGNGTISGKYAVLGKLGLCTGILTTGGTTTYGTGTYSFTLPAGWSAAGAVGTVVGAARIFDTSTSTRYVGVVTIASATTLAVSTHAATTDASGTVPMTWASGDSIVWQAALELS